jgi:hypothetical protein
MESCRSILTTLVFVSGSFSVVMAVVWLYSPKGTLISEINRAKIVIDVGENNREKRGIEYWVNIGYLRFIKCFLSIAKVSIGITIVSIIFLRLLTLFGV